MHLIAPVNALPYGEKTYQQFGGRNTLAPCDLQDEFNNLVLHITRKTTGGGRTFTVQGYYFFDTLFRALALAITRFRYFGLSA
jgi:hypothetical protein